jgi:predicted nucleic acid-binding protein
MTTPPKRWLLDTNVWVFGMRRDEAFPACASLLDRIGSFSVYIPLQVLKELSLVLTEGEMRDFYWLVNKYSEFIELSWEPVTPQQIKSYEERGCRKGDAVIAAHAEISGIRTIISENRQFLQTQEGLPIELINADEATTRLSRISTEQNG